MNENFEEIKKIIASLVDLKFLPVIKGNIRSLREFVDKCKIEFLHIQQLAEASENFDEAAVLPKVVDIYTKIETLISHYFKKDDFKSISDEFPEYYAALNKFIADSKTTVTEFQDNERFIGGPKDKTLLKFLKLLKKFFLSLHNFPISFTNIFRRLFKKSVKEKKQWKRIVLLRNLRQVFFEHNLSKELIKLNGEYYQLRSNVAKELWAIYELLDKQIAKNLYPENDVSKTDSPALTDLHLKINELNTKINQFDNSLNNKIKNVLDSLLSSYRDAYTLAGTIEFPKKHLSKSVLKKNNKLLQGEFKKTHNGWANNFTALGDDWEMNAELYTIRYNSIIELENYKQRFNTSIKEKLIPLSDKILSVINGFVASIKSSSTKSELSNNSQNIKKEINSLLTKELLVNATDALAEQNLTSLTAEFEDIVREFITNVKKQRTLVKTDNYDREIRDSELNLFSPKEILEYSAAPKFFSKTQKLKSLINAKILQIQNEVAEIDHVSDFTIESSLNLLESENNVDESKKIAIDGLERVVKKLDEIKSNFNGLSSEFSDDLYKTVKEFNNDLDSLTKTEKIFDIRLKLAKAKALESSRALRKKAIENIKNFIPHVLWLGRKSFRSLLNSYSKLKAVFGFIEPTKTITSEVSDYLAETQSAIQRLPFVYQRLFDIKPLEDLRFFFGREPEVKELNKSLLNWEKTKFAPTIIVGEKGSGASSLINCFLTENQKTYAVTRILLTHPLSNINSFLELVAQSLNHEEFKDANSLIDYLNNLSSKKIIIIENLQRLFLKTISGFQSLNSFFEIISRTNKNIFWISTSTVYGWKYLEKTIQAPDYFAYVINLKKLTEDQITSLVLKRHRVSGYNILYEADEATEKSKTYKKLSEEERQIYLKKKYFEELNKFAQSNISLALIFWLRSAKEVINDVIKIGAPPDLDYSFLENLSNDKIFALASMVMHDGLTDEDHSVMFNIQLTKSQLLLMLMHDDGIIIKQQNLFVVNPLLYRQIVALLKSRNILH